MIETRAAAVYTILLCFLVMAGTVSVMKYPPQLDKLMKIFAKSSEARKNMEVPLSASASVTSFPEADIRVDAQSEPKAEVQPETELDIQSTTKPDIQIETESEVNPEVVAEAVTDSSVVGTLAPELPILEAVSPPEPTQEVVVDAPVTTEPKEKKVVTFDIPEDDEDLEPLSRTTTIDQSSPTEGDSDEATPVPAGKTTSATSNGSTEGIAQDPNSATATPTKKKKTHRGKRGGRKLNKNQQKEEDDVDRIVDAAKKLDPTPTLHPDEVTMNGDDMQDVSNIKRIGKLTIDQDKLLGNGSGGTFVFEGKWNVSIESVDAMTCANVLLRTVTLLSKECCPSTLVWPSRKSSFSRRATCTPTLSVTLTTRRTRTSCTLLSKCARPVSSTFSGMAGLAKTSLIPNVALSMRSTETSRALCTSWPMVSITFTV
jgi:serine/threonine-protein kinase/endoribonuclease IRE1